MPEAEPEGPFGFADPQSQGRPSGLPVDPVDPADPVDPVDLEDPLEDPDGNERQSGSSAAREGPGLGLAVGFIAIALIAATRR